MIECFTSLLASIIEILYFYQSIRITLNHKNKIRGISKVNYKDKIIKKDVLD